VARFVEGGGGERRRGRAEEKGDVKRLVKRPNNGKTGQ